MTTTTNLGLTLVEQAQAQKEVTVNEALVRIDALLNRGALDKDLATPPGSPASGDLYIVAASPTGDWSGHAGEIAYYEQIWRFVTPNEGLTLWVSDEDELYSYDGSAWNKAVPNRRSQGKTSLMIAADLWNVTSVPGPASPGGTLAGGVAFRRRQFNNTQKLHCQFAWTPPKSWDGGTVSFRVFGHTDGTDTNGMLFGLQGVAVSPGEDISAATFGSAQEVTLNGTGSANDQYVSAESAAVTISGAPQAGDMVYLQFYRDAATDTSTNYFNMIAVELFFTTDKENDA